MIPKDHLRKLARKILEKTQAKEVAWTASDSAIETAADSGGTNVRCELILKESSVSVTYRSPLAEPDEIRFEVNELLGPNNATPVGSFAAQRVETSDNDYADWELLRDLYFEASKVAYGWDYILSEVEAAVNSSGRIGRNAVEDEKIEPSTTSPR